MEAVKDAKRLFEAERSAQDTFYVLQGRGVDRLPERRFGVSDGIRV